MAMDIAFVPLSLITPIAPMPGGVAMATTVSSQDCMEQIYGRRETGDGRFL